MKPGDLVRSVDGAPLWPTSMEVETRWSSITTEIVWLSDSDLCVVTAGPRPGPYGAMFVEVLTPLGQQGMVMMVMLEVVSPSDIG